MLCSSHRDANAPGEQNHVEVETPCHTSNMLSICGKSNSAITTQQPFITDISQTYHDSIRIM